MFAVKNYIGGEFLAAQSGAVFENIEPATGLVYSTVSDSDERDVQRAVESAKQSFPRWSETAISERSRILLRIADDIERRLEELSHAESVDTGKPLSLARSVDIPRAAQNFRFFAGAMLGYESESQETDSLAINITLRRPRGICGLIAPWNLPLYLLSWKIAPALAAGNVVVAKPSELTPVTAQLLGEICSEAGLPPGVLNIVQGTGRKAGASIVQHAQIGTISFTGGTATGREIGRVCGEQFKRVSLELGGKNPTIIFADADLDEVVPQAIKAAFSNQGEICLCGSRILVQEQIYSEFIERFVSQVKALRLGDPLQEETQQGALISKAHLEKVKFYVGLAQEEGGKILCGGRIPTELPDRVCGGFFFEPTVITGLDRRCRVNQEEIFGPVATVMPFRSEEEAVHIANSVVYGLAASVWTSDVKRAYRVARDVEAGIVWVNCWMVRDLRVPFGGIKQSGVGREGGRDAIRFFTEPKSVCLRIS